MSFATETSKLTTKSYHFLLNACSVKCIFTRKMNKLRNVISKFEIHVNFGACAYRTFATSYLPLVRIYDFRENFYQCSNQPTELQPLVEQNIDVSYTILNFFFG